MQPPVWAVVAALVVSISVGLLFGSLPARRAAALDPVEALDAEAGMIFEDVFAQAWRAIRGHRQRSALTMLGILIGIASVILLTSIGEGTRLYILYEFTQFGTNLVVDQSREDRRRRDSGAVWRGTIHPLTLGDARRWRAFRGVEKVVPVVDGRGAGRARGEGPATSSSTG